MLAPGGQQPSDVPPQPRPARTCPEPPAPLLHVVFFWEASSSVAGGVDPRRGGQGRPADGGASSDEFDLQDEVRARSWSFGTHENDGHRLSVRLMFRMQQDPVHEAGRTSLMASYRAASSPHLSPTGDSNVDATAFVISLPVALFASRGVKIPYMVRTV